jgi:hypothetical protein
MRLRHNIICAVVLTLTVCARAAEPALGYNRDVRPILSDNCFACHGPDKGNRKAKLRLDVREDAIAKEAFVPGKPEESELVKRLFTTNEDDVMPPADSHKKLSAAQKEILKRWVAEGAVYEPHWSFIAPKRPAVPALANRKTKITNPIDAFILAPLEAKKIQPSPEADRATLLRRVSLDLIGLPPTSEEMAAFLKDKSAKAYEKQVDRLLASPHFGERMAVPWLDIVRFADTVGYHGDQNVNVFPYRDYVINAFNANKPFDQFTIEQLAGDLLPNNTVEQRVATGFNRLNMMTREGGAQPKEYMAKYGADRARTVGMAWMGLTVGCAECHDHKFDPFTAKDFYSLKAYFADVRQWGVYSDYKYTPNPDLKNWSNEHPFPPEEVVESPYLKRRIEKLNGQIQELAKNSAAEKTAQAQRDAWDKSTKAVLARHRDGWIVPTAFPLVTNVVVVTNKLKLTNMVAATEGKPAATNVTAQISTRTNTTVLTNFVVQADGSLLYGSKGDGHPIPLRLEAGSVAALRLELIPHAKHSNTIFRGKTTSATIQLSATIRRAGAKKETKLTFYHADADHKEPRYANGYEIIGIKDSWKVARDQAKEKQTGVWLLDPPVTVNEGDTLTIALKTNVIGNLRLSVSPFVPGKIRGEPTSIDLIEQKFLTSSATKSMAWLVSAASDTNAFAQYKKLHREIQECRGGKSPTVVTVAWKPEPTRVLPRGNWLSDDGELVQPEPPHFLPQPKRAGTNQLTRLDLARWLVSAENPLTARVAVNRLWKQVYGAALATPVDDLGLQGEPPTHPELLDWLAVEFREKNWDVKHLVRLLVTSSTYKQSSKLRSELREVDPNNRWLASQNPRRLEAEFVRDNALAISGLLNNEIGGPSAHPYQPADYYVNLQFPDRDYYASQDDRQYRRGVYAHWQRTFLQPMLANFDAPSREECTALRPISNTPQQALTLLNDPSFVEAARVLAQKLMASPAKSDDARIELAYQRALGRNAKPTELASLKKFLAGQREHLQSDADEPVKLQKVGLAATPKDADAVELAAWTSVCRVVLNLHETITIY